MELPLPDRLYPTRDLLMRSLAPDRRDQAPAMPEHLASDILSRFTSQPLESVSPRTPFFSAIREWLASPGFGLAAAAVIVVGVAIPMLSAPDTAGREIFRGSSSMASREMVRIAFVGENSELEAAVKASGHFEAFAFAADAASLPGPKIVIDFRRGTISAVAFEGDTVHSAPLPVKARDVADAVADAVSRL